MGEYMRGVVVKLHLTPEQEVEFKKNYGCTRKTYNELLSKYKTKYGGESTKIPTQKELNQFLKESRKELPYLGEMESTSLQQARDDLHKAFKNTIKNRHNPPKFHTKKKTRPSFRQTIRKDKRPIEKNTLTLRKHGTVTFSTSIEYLDLLNIPILNSTT